MLAVEIEVEADGLDKRFSNQRNRCAPNRILSGKPTGEGVVVSGAQIVGAAFCIVVLPAVTEGVRVALLNGQLVPKTIIAVIQKDVPAPVRYIPKSL